MLEKQMYPYLISAALIFIIPAMFNKMLFKSKKIRAQRHSSTQCLKALLLADFKQKTHTNFKGKEYQRGLSACVKCRASMGGMAGGWGLLFPTVPSKEGSGPGEAV